MKLYTYICPACHQTAFSESPTAPDQCADCLLRSLVEEQPDTVEPNCTSDSLNEMHKPSTEFRWSPITRPHESAESLQEFSNA
jgi:hypothetical protein